MALVGNHDILQHRHALEQTNILKRAPHPAAANFIKWQCAYFTALETDTAGGRTIETGNRIQ